MKTIYCTCCGEVAKRQCADHDRGYGVCTRCLDKYGRASFCQVDCAAHGPKLSVTIDKVDTAGDTTEKKTER